MADSPTAGSPTPSRRSQLEQALELELERRVPPADAETAPGRAPLIADVHHRDPLHTGRDFLDHAVTGDPEE